ncbi:MAG: substrate-binding domain-containing protein, partial [Erythrobacter sp.]|nr:substrate-binding domain-containing protein [Erythrobacter sp.]
RLIGEHLAQTGRRRIAFLGDIALPEVRLRYDGFIAALTAAGIDHPQELVLTTSFVAEDAQAVLREAIASGVTFDAIAAASDVLAMSAMTVLQAEGMRVPDDVAVTGYDNIGQSKLATPPLTTIDQSIALGGEMLVDLLLRKIAGEAVSSQMTPTSLIIRQSTGG